MFNKTTFLRKGLLLLCGLFSFNIAFAQDLSQAIPFDNTVKTGVLPNGIKYYIRKNARPEKRVELRLAINAGSILEDKDQLGLAHFMEHMAFNGTKNFKKNELVSYLQSIGVKFGADLNAYTSFDETVYILPIPSDKKDILDKGFQVLEDWAHNVTFDHEEIDKERGVIMEEWRSRTGVQDRIQKVTLPKMFKGSQYPDRLPIGDTGIIKTFKYDVIKRFYKDWYRADLMGVMVVGDIDVAEMEEKIKFHFGRIAKPTNPRTRPNFEIPDHSTTEIAIATDKEQAFGQVQLMYKKDGKKMKTLGDYRQKLVYDIYNQMLNARLQELTKTPEPPFLFGFTGYGQIGLGFKNAYQSFAQVSETGAMLGLKTLLLENKRVVEHGFVASELERAKQEVLKNFEKQYNERNKTESGRLVGEYVQHFLEEEPVPGIEFEFDFAKKVVATINLDEINPLAKKWITDENRVVVIVLPEKDNVKVPKEAEVRALLDEIKSISVSPYQDKVITEPLMSKMPTAGKIVKEKKLAGIDATEYTLSNGVKVVLKKTTFKDDEVRLSAFAKGGTSLATDKEFISAQYADDLINEMGVSKFSSNDIEKMMTGKNVDINPYISETGQGFFGNASPKDLESMFQMIYLYNTDVRKSTEDFKSYVTKNSALYKNLMNNPQFFFIGEVAKVMSQNHPRAQGLPKAEDLEKINIDEAMAFYKARFADASGFTYVFVGNFDEQKIKPLIETYIASLPSKGKKETFKDLGIRPPKGIVEKSITKGKDPRSNVMIAITDDLKNPKDGYYIRMLAEVLTIKLIENLREEKGGVYGTRASASITTEPRKSYSVTVNFTCAPENVTKLTNAVYEEIEKIQKNGPTQVDLDKVKETQRRDIEKNVKENNYWLNGLRRIYTDKADPKGLLEASARQRIDALTIQDIQKASKKYLDLKKNRINFTMIPETPAPTEIKSGKNEQSASGKPADKLNDKITVNEVIENYIKAIGGKEKLQTVTSLKQDIKMSVMGMEIEMNTIKKGNKFAMTQKQMGQEMNIKFDGKKGYMVSPQGKKDMPADQLKSMEETAINFFELEYAKYGYEAALNGTQKIEGRNAYKVEYKKDGKVVKTNFYDAGTFLSVGDISVQGENTITEHQTINGITFPKTLKTKAQGMEIDSTIKIEVNPTIDDKIFE